MSKSEKSRAEIVEKKGERFVRITLSDGSRIDAHKVNGRIIFDKPERVPRHIRTDIVPNLFKQIEREYLQNL